MPEEKRLTRKELYDLVWSKSMRTLAKDFNLSDVGLAKICSVIVFDDSQKPFGLFESLLEIFGMSETNGRAAAERHGQRIRADDSDGRKFDLDRAFAVVAVGQQQELVDDVVPDNADV